PPQRAHPRRPARAWCGRRERSSGGRHPCPTAPSSAGRWATSSKARSYTRCECAGSSALVTLDAAAQVFLGRDHLAFELGRVDHGAAHAAHEDALEAIKNNNNQIIAGANGRVCKTYKQVSRRSARASRP